MAMTRRGSPMAPLETPKARTPTSPSYRAVSWGSVMAGCLASCALMFVLVVLAATTATFAGKWPPAPATRLDGRAIHNDVLVMYIFSNTDPQYLNNLKFFVREGVRLNDGCEYIFVINRSPNEEELDLPTLPRNARYVHHTNECFDWGTFGWVLSSQRVEVARYKYFIFMNSSVRGPFMPSYIHGRVHWVDVLTSKINDKVKLVGSTINCEGAPLHGDPEAIWRKNPHVQSFVVATDQVGMQLLVADDRIFRCYEHLADTIYNSELGTSAAILNAGYNIDSLMVRYQGVDWLDHNNWGCNKERNPFGSNYLDGSDVEAMEVMFVKVKGPMLERRTTYAVHAQHFDHWMLTRDQGMPDVLKNSYVDDVWSYKADAVLAMAMRGHTCFDCEHYRRHNQDLPEEMTDCVKLFEHLCNYGQFEGRNFRFMCKVSYEDMLPLVLAPSGDEKVPYLTSDKLQSLLVKPSSRRDVLASVAIENTTVTDSDSLEQERSDGRSVQKVLQTDSTGEHSGWLQV